MGVKKSSEYFVIHREGLNEPSKTITYEKGNIGDIFMGLQPSGTAGAFMSEKRFPLTNALQQGGAQCSRGLI